MKKNFYKVIACIISVLGTVLSIYVGGYWLLVRPVKYLYFAVMNHTITTKALAICITKIFFASTATGGIWSICDIIAGKFRDRAALCEKA
ncbi:MAG: hypothetical protein K6B67_00325 [Lachnospiraceae bacterium]|nr:hypothetical protein [Lachnospiraceae bacterium]